MSQENYGPLSLAREFHNIDFYKDRFLKDQDHRYKIIQSSQGICRSPDASLFDFEIVKKSGKEFYRLSALDQEIISRKCARIIRKKQKPSKSRNQITKEIQAFIEEPLPLNIHRTDIKSFFKSIEKKHVISALEYFSIDQQTISITKSIIESYHAKGQHGLPKGNPVSHPISELCLAGLDESLSQHPEIFYYARFVDDIIMITSPEIGEREARIILRRTIPPGLKINKEKTSFVDRQENGKEKSFNFLGYEFFSTPRKSSPTITKTGISESREQKYKAKIFKSFMSFQKSGDFDLLIDRIRFLFNNRKIIDKKSKSYRLTGAYYDQPLINCKDRLRNIDSFKNLIITKKYFHNKTGEHLSLTRKQKSRLLGLSIEKGFEERKFYSFSPSRLADISRIWK